VPNLRLDKRLSLALEGLLGSRGEYALCSTLLSSCRPYLALRIGQSSGSYTLLQQRYLKAQDAPPPVPSLCVLCSNFLTVYVLRPIMIFRPYASSLRANTKVKVVAKGYIKPML